MNLQVRDKKKNTLVDFAGANDPVFVICVGSQAN